MEEGKSSVNDKGITQEIKGWTHMRLSGNTSWDWYVSY